MKKSVEKVGGETGTKNMKELCCKRKKVVHYADGKKCGRDEAHGQVKGELGAQSGNEK